MSPLVAPPPTPLSAEERLRSAWERRHESDDIIRFSTAFGWIVLTGGLYSLYVLYQLVRRSREHNRRRLELLEAASDFTWEQARARGLTSELRPQFQRVADRTRNLRALTSEFRDPGLWVGLAFATAGIAQIVAWVHIDRDLVRHDEAERAIERDLAAIYARLGRPISTPDPPHSKGKHRVGGRIIATVASLGIYTIWWMRDVMNDGNAHLRRNWRFDDELARATRDLMYTTILIGA
jgi:hypothetical protein